MGMGAKFREMPPCNKSKLYTMFEEAVANLKNKLVKSCHPIKSCAFDKWESVLLNKIKSKIARIPRKKMEPNQILNTPEMMKYIQELHARFVIVPIDKASNNFAIICKAF